MKLELGVGNRPTDGYLSQDITELVPLDFHCNPWEVDLDANSLDEVLALGVMEHLRYQDFRLTVKHIHHLLKSGGIFLFDVPDLTIWSEYLFDVLHGKTTVFSRDHILNTIYGWQRWEGDEHKSGWTMEMLLEELDLFTDVRDGKEDMNQRVSRNRFERKEDAHIYIKAIK